MTNSTGKILGTVIAGGKSSRMGEDKALMLWRGRPLMAHVAARLAPQVDALIINGAPERFAQFAFPVVGDERALATPLCGLHAALAHAGRQGFAAVLTAPCDTPLLPLDLHARLQGEGAAIAVSRGQAHYLCGYWPVALLPSLEKAMDEGLIRVMDFAALVKARHVAWNGPEDGPDPFINLNTPEDLALLP